MPSDVHGRVPDDADPARYTAASLRKLFPRFRRNTVVYLELYDALRRRQLVPLKGREPNGTQRRTPEDGSPRLRWSQSEYNTRHINHTHYSRVDADCECLLINSMKQILPAFYRTRSFSSAFTTGRRTVRTLGQINPVHALISYFLKLHLSITLTSTPRSYKWSVSFRFHH